MKSCMKFYLWWNMTSIIERKQPAHEFEVLISFLAHSPFLSHVRPYREDVRNSSVLTHASVGSSEWTHDHNPGNIQMQLIESILYFINVKFSIWYIWAAKGSDKNVSICQPLLSPHAKRLHSAYCLFHDKNSKVLFQSTFKITTAAIILLSIMLHHYNNFSLSIFKLLHVNAECF